MRLPKYRPPTHPGEILVKDFLEPLGILPDELAQIIDIPNEQINKQHRITPSTALKLAELWGNSVDFWIKLQANWELYHTSQYQSI
ncbi:addiction module antidote protein, HigA family [Nostoc sp. PCC 7524]|uniref:HigA family addiction module antitoxin n=1 Tax=Nostoc sp. (strain ATCC 29411 / PCC 7524) TaxID=28072 RepID=UPI00029F31AA|nr:HigA family addiction module antitoxin [Nostoc sp. PCC 7524]AFY47323.1 addiction module antidote protein, HigA family [Nostoc sp. PCC 7524]